MPETDEKTELKKLPPLTLSLIIITFVLLLIAVFGFVFPQYKGIGAAKADRIEKETLLEEQKQLFPIYAQALALEKTAFEPKLPFVERSPLDRDRIFSLSSVFQDIAVSHNMELSQNSQDINSLRNNSNLLSMDIMFSGGLQDYRNTLISLSELPFFNAVEKISISTDPSNIKKFSTQILITLDKK